MAERDDKDNGEQEKSSSNRGKIKFLFFLGILIMLSGSVAGTLYYVGYFSKDDIVAADMLKMEVKKPVYYSFEEPFTVNFETEAGIRYLQVKVELMAMDQKAIDLVQVHTPAIRNNLILIFSSQSYLKLMSREGKEELRATVLDEIRKILIKYGPKDGDEKMPNVEEVYFTSFVIQ